MLEVNEKRWAFHLVLLAICAVLTVLAYYPGLAGDYLFDDFPNILNNRHVHIQTLDLESLKSAAFSMGVFLDRPISMVSFALNHYFFGIAPYSFKVVNLIIHILNGLLIYLLTELLLKALQKTQAQDDTKIATNWLSLAVTFAWIIHPIQLTSVLYVVQRMTSLATLFMLVGLILYTYGRTRMLNHESGLPIVAFGLLLFGTLAVFSKENGVLLPVYMLAIEFVIFGFKRLDGTFDYRILCFFLVTVLIPAASLVAWLLLNPEWILKEYAWRDFTLTERALTEPRILWHYLRLILLPSTSDLGLHHDDIGLSKQILDPITTLPAILGLFAAALLALLVKRPYPVISLGILWFLTGHLIESSVFPLEIVHEHRNYLASYGILLIVFNALLSTKYLSSILVIRRYAALILLGLFFVTTSLRSSQWSDNITHAEYEVIHHPNSPRALAAAGRIYANLAITQNYSDHAKIRRYLEKSGELDKGTILPYVILIMYSYQINDEPEEYWISTTRQRLQTRLLGPGHVTALKSLTRCQTALQKGCKLPDEQLLEFFQLALENEITQSPKTRADIYSLKGEYLFNRMRDPHQAIEAFRNAVNERPTERQYRMNLIRALISIKQYNLARKELNLARTVGRIGSNAKDLQELELLLQ